MAAYARRAPQKNMLSAFLVFSSVLHGLFFLITVFVQPLISPKPEIKVITFNLLPEAPAPAAEGPAEEPALPPAPSPPIKQIAPKKPAPPTERIRTKETPVAMRPLPPLAEQPAAIQAAAPAPAPAPAPAAPAEPVRSPAQEENDLLAKQVDSLLTRANGAAVSSPDYLAGGSWTGAPRKTVAFPNIKARIAELENSKGYGYSVTARITFTSQGWVSMVELTRASGDPRIDNIFRNELRKIRIEESSSGSIDTVMKSFVISVQ